MQKEQRILTLLINNYSMNFDRVKFYRKGGCISYVVSSGYRKYLLKVVSKAFMDTIKQSTEILRFLEEKDFSVPRIVFTIQGLPFLNFTTDEGDYTYILYDFIDGIEPELGEDVKQIGILVGKLHRIMQGYEGNLTKRKKKFFINRYINLLRKKSYPDSKIDIFEEYGDVLWKSVERLPQGYSHGDLHRGNLLRTYNGNYYMLDFDTSCYSFPMFDVMVMCDSTNYFEFEEEGYKRTKLIYESFLNGYTRERNLSDIEVSSFYDLIAVRHFQLQATIIEIHGLDCINNQFIDNQLDWLLRWRSQLQNL